MFVESCQRVKTEIKVITKMLFFNYSSWTQNLYIDSYCTVYFQSAIFQWFDIYCAVTCHYQLTFGLYVQRFR